MGTRNGASFSSIRVACLVLVDQAGNLLATRRPPGKNLGGKWEFPGGKIESGEPCEVALRREIREELNIEIGQLVKLEPVVHTYDFAVVTLIPFIARCEERPRLNLVEHTEARWLRLADCLILDWAPADLPILGQLESRVLIFPS